MIKNFTRNSFVVYYQGAPGAYSEQAIMDFAKKYKLKFIPKESKNFSELFKNIKTNGLGMVPIENSTAGSVVECYDLLLKYDLEIIGEINVEINHCLLAKKGATLKNIKEVYSHPQALMQSMKFIEKHNFNPISFTDTAASAKFIAKQNDLTKAAISSELSAKIYNLEIIEKKIQSIKENTTRFFLVKNKEIDFSFEKKFKYKNKSSITFETKDTPGALYKCLGALTTHNLNLSKIESRPNHKKNFSYSFFLDIQDSLQDKNSKSAIDEIKYFTHNLRILGSYESAK